MGREGGKSSVRRGRAGSPRFLSGTGRDGSWNGSGTGRELGRVHSREIGPEHSREIGRYIVGKSVGRIVQNRSAT